MRESLGVSLPGLSGVAGFSEQDTPWVDVVGGQRRLMHADIERGVWAIGVRYEPGSGTERHRHTGEVFGFTYSGRWMYREYGHEYIAGTFVHERAGSTHTLVVPTDNTEITEVFFVVHGANLIVDENDQVVRVNDAASMSARIRALCIEQGKPIPVFLEGRS
jgi:2,4'-dihydroxyacetophenone dioxygenase